MNTNARPVDDASAWTAGDIGRREGLVRRLGAEQFEAIDEAVRATASKQPTEVTAADFSAEPIRDLMAAVRHEIVRGKGAVVLSGLDVGRYRPEEFARLYFGLGTHLGRAAPQSPRMDRIGVVQQEPNPEMRGYLADIELRPHTDFHEIMGLAAVQTAESGGVSGFVSSAAVYNAVLAEHPELLPALLRGFPYPISTTAVTDYEIPTISLVDGKVSLYHYIHFLFLAAEIMGRPVPDDLIRGLRFVAAVARRPGFGVRFVLQPGEIVFWANFKVLHARTAFKNSETKRRRLLRLWLHSHEPRPMAKGYLEIAQRLDELHAAGESTLGNTRERMKLAYEALYGNAA